jgi:SAM-dependent methyltransferase
MTSMPRSYFDEMYHSDPDPWQFESSWYEQRKYELTMAALPERRYRSAFEPGCSVGVLSSLLAERCDQLLATDIVPAVVQRALDRCQRFSGVRVEVRAIPERWPTGPFDLVVLSEIAYYFDVSRLNEIMAQVLATTSEGATVVGVHWRGTTNYPLTGDEAHAVMASTPGLEARSRYVESDFVLDIWSRRPMSAL